MRSMRSATLLSILCFFMVLSSCKVFYPNLMFRSKNQQAYQLDTTVTDTAKKPYMIAPGDKLRLYLFSNEGYKLVDVTTEGGQQRMGRRSEQVEYLVQQNGYAKLPIIDSVKIEGYSIKKAEQMLEEKYAKYINRPFVVLRVTNRRAFVFIGNQQAKVVPIQNQNTSLIEVLAQAGGISEKAKAYRIKIIRDYLEEPIVKYIDLSTMRGLGRADLSVQANDIIYVEPVIRVAPELVKEISPWVSLLASVATVVFLVTELQNRAN